MSSPAKTGKSETLVEADGCQIDLRNPYLAALLAFLIPGAGHFYQGRTNKAYLYAACILGLFFLGLFLGQGRVVYASWSPEDYRIQFPAQMCVGLPAFPALVQAIVQSDDEEAGSGRGRLSPARLNTIPTEPSEWKWSEFMAPPRDLNVLSQWHYEGSAGFELGTLFTAVAGLLNLLAIFDAFAGPMPLPHSPERRKKS
ncbi:TM2 domain protein [Pirellula sp. SH-Sr6A]|uniref:DUF6677 family protein n=1 Tax=Pirellula sp. SH-Sr6A TaxID=1632865 RepID=UPI00078EAA8A|nr:DUF6677 family protein [Pirellula sp. SH-Sr6A]AMV31001.1 TM2 domain protein [Pirellula sp. SH-Sr6A]